MGAESQPIDTVEQARELIVSATSEDAPPAARERFEADWPCVVALGSRDPAAREALRDLIPALARVEEELDGAAWVALLLSVLDDEPFVAIEFPPRTGIAGRMSGVVDNFQLHTLLMEAMPQRRALFGRRKHRVSRAAVANARGTGPHQIDEEILGAWNLYTYRALRNGELPPPDVADREHWLWNEGRPSDIPSVDGHRVILLGLATYERTWNAARAFPELAATLEHRELIEQEIDAWLARIEESGNATDPHT
jgi:hypothetical protein